jgi:hypothetical protein
VELSGFLVHKVNLCSSEFYKLCFGQLCVLRGSLRIASPVTTLSMMATESSDFSKALAKNLVNLQTSEGGSLRPIVSELMDKDDENCMKNILIRWNVDFKHKLNSPETFNAVLSNNRPTESE